MTCWERMEQVPEVPRSLMLEVSREVVADLRKASHLFPNLAWESSGAPALVSDGIAKVLSRLLNTPHKLDGKGVDLPEYNTEVAAGMKIMKSNPHDYGKGPARFLWLCRMDKFAAYRGWAGAVEIRYGILDSVHFGKRGDGKKYHGVNANAAAHRGLELIGMIEADPTAPPSKKKPPKAKKPPAPRKSRKKVVVPDEPDLLTAIESPQASVPIHPEPVEMT